MSAHISAHISAYISTQIGTDIDKGELIHLLANDAQSTPYGKDYNAVMACASALLPHGYQYE